MKESRKAVEAYNNNNTDYYYSTSDLPCKKHPSSSSVGVCALCLKDRLVNLVCSDCGERRLSSCSCSEISFLIENEKNNEKTHFPNSSSKPKLQDKAEETMLLRRNSSNCVEIKRRSRFWRIGKLFRKKEKDFDLKSATNWNMVDHVHGGGVSWCRSLCSFRGDGLFGSEDGGDSNSSHSILSGASRSSISVARSFRLNGYCELEPRKIGFDGEKKDFMFDSENGSNDIKGVKKGGLMDFDGGFYGVHRRVFSLRESDFKGLDESCFIDLELDYYSSESKPEFPAFGSTRGGSFKAHDGGGSFGGLVEDGVLNSGRSCRITVNERGVKRGRKNLKGWRWIFRNHPSWGTARK